jgi:DNA helicase-2/ATP-dependent DNA helicase PcrA
MYGRFQNNQDSEFIAEIDPSLLERQGLAKQRMKPDPTFPKPEARSEHPQPTPSYVPSGIRLAIGDKVKHAVFGDGIVVMIDADKATIAFRAPVGIKILMKDHPSIQKA